MRDGKPALSRKALNVLILVTASLILIFSQMGPEDQAEQKSEDEQQNQISKLEKPPENLTIAHYFPELKSVPEIPEAGIDLNIQHWITPQGMSVYFVESTDLPMVDIRLVFDGGSARDPQEKAGLASATANLLGLGAVGMNATSVAKEFELLGAQTSVGSYRDMAIGTLRVLREAKYFEPSVDLFSRVMSEIEFSSDDFAREINRQKVGIAHKAQSPQAQLGDAVFDVLYGASHPYGRPSSGTLESVGSFDVADIVGFHNQYYSAKNAVLAVVGDLTKAQVEAMAQIFAARLGENEAPEPISTASVSVQERQRHVQFDSDQTHIALVGPGIYRDHEDFYALFLANHILGGGGFASLLNKEIRQEKAFAYSVGSNVTPMAGVGPVTIQMQTRGDQAAAAIAATQQVVDQLAKEGPTAQVLADAKQQILSEFAMRAASNSSQLGYLGSIGFYDLPMDYLQTFNDKIESIQAKDIQSVTKQYFSNLAVVTVGAQNPL